MIEIVRPFLDMQIHPRRCVQKIGIAVLRNIRVVTAPRMHVLAMIGLVCAMAAPRLHAQIDPGDVLPSFTLKSYDGRDYAIDKIRRGAKGIVVLFMTDRCPRFLDEVGHLNALEKEYRAKGILFVGIAVERKESADELHAAVRANNIAYPILQDPRGEQRKRFGVREVPEAFVFSGDGVCLYRGRIDDVTKGRAAKRQYLREAMDAALGGKAMHPARTDADGCRVR
jgi:peroxiredoxin